MYIIPYTASDTELVDKLAPELEKSVKKHQINLKITKKSPISEKPVERLIVDAVLNQYHESLIVTSEKAYLNSGFPTFGRNNKDSILVSTNGENLSVENLVDLSLHELGPFIGLGHHYSVEQCSMIPLKLSNEDSLEILYGKISYSRFVYEQLKTRTPGYCSACVPKIKPFQRRT